MMNDRLHCRVCSKQIPARRRRNAEIRGRTALYDTDVCARHAARAAYRARQRTAKRA
jgi:hypothetical protein